MEIKLDFCQSRLNEIDPIKRQPENNMKRLRKKRKLLIQKWRDFKGLFSELINLFKKNCKVKILFKLLKPKRKNKKLEMIVVFVVSSFAEFFNILLQIFNSTELKDKFSAKM